MKTQTPFNPTDQTDFIDYLKECFIHPLECLGYTFKSIGSLNDPDEGTIMHHLLFTGPWPNKLTKEQTLELDKICTQDDDSQPSACYSNYFGTLYLFIPVTT